MRARFKRCDKLALGNHCELKATNENQKILVILFTHLQHVNT